MYRFFASCPRGIEPLLAEELAQFGVNDIKPGRSGVRATGTLEQLYRCCLWSRLANRILLVLGEFDCKNRETLYQGIADIDWPSQMEPEQTLAVDFWGTNPGIKNTHFGAQVVKDAIVDQMREGDLRPRVAAVDPDIRINAHLHRDTCTVSLDLSGHSLHQRGYREAAGPAPLKENLAAAILIRSGWPACAEAGQPLVDPMCGSGTFLIEAAMMAGDIAPGLLARHWGFAGWKQHDATLWQKLQQDAQQRAAKGRDRIPAITGYDQHPVAIRNCRQNLSTLDLEDKVRLVCASLEQQLAANEGEAFKPGKGLLVCNPPYGQRLGEQEDLTSLYHELGELLKKRYPEWTAGVFTADSHAGQAIPLYSHKQYRLYNGALECRLLLFMVRSREAQAAISKPVDHESYLAGLDEQELGFLNRLKKNHKKLEKWAKREGISCYRLYDADLPDFAAAIDLYEDHVVIQEYAAPKTIERNKAQQRFSSLRKITRSYLKLPFENLHLKQRKQQKGSAQYQSQSKTYGEADDGGGDERVIVRDGNIPVYVNFDTYLDTGLFLDHRPLRQRIGREAAGKRFLNLFCYTGVATCHALAGGASESVSVDMSRTYLNWAADNLRLNGNTDVYKHRLIRQDCLSWLETASGEFDLIMLDPPTFSNSKNMEGVLDIQRDHPTLLASAMRLLSTNGTLYFSTNFSKFRLDDSLAELYQLEDITQATLDPDFARQPPIHRCWKITHKQL